MRVRIHDLSLGGCLLEAPLSIDIGHRLTLCLDLPGEHWLSLKGEAVRIAERSKFAVKFLEMDPTKEHRLQRVIDRMIAATVPASTIDGGADVS